LTNRKFSLVARVSTENPTAVKRAIKEFAPKGSVTATEGGFVVKAELRGASARDLNRKLLSALRRVERKTRLRAEWTSGDTTERFFDYVPKGTRKIGGSSRGSCP
jgi:hypothetical protein